MEKHFNETHGKSKKRIYNIWKRMKQRCLNKSCKDYFRYGGRGITICNDWVKFENFYNDMKYSYKENLSLDRIDNDKNYYKENCQWSTPKEQGRNKRNNQIIEFKGIKKCLSEWAEDLGIKRSTLSQRYYVYKWSIEKCLTYRLEGGQIGI